MVEEILAGKLDLGFVEGYIEAVGLQRQPVGRNEVVLIAPPWHRLAGQADIAATELTGEIFVMREAGSGTRQAMEGLMASLSLSPPRTLELPSCEAVKRAVAAGLGLSFVSRYAIALKLGQNLLALLSGPGLSLADPLYLTSRKDVRLSQAVLAFLAFVRKQGAFEQR